MALKSGYLLYQKKFVSLIHGRDSTNENNIETRKSNWRFIRWKKMLAENDGNRLSRDKTAEIISSIMVANNEEWHTHRKQLAHRKSQSCSTRYSTIYLVRIPYIKITSRRYNNALCHSFSLALALVRSWSFSTCRLLMSLTKATLLLLFFRVPFSMLHICGRKLSLDVYLRF